MKTAMKVLNLARPTEGDKEFYSRWWAVYGGDQGGEINFRDRNPKDIELLVVDQYVQGLKDIISKLPHLKYIVSATTGHTHLKGLDMSETASPRVLTLAGEREFLNSLRGVSEYTIRWMLHIALMKGVTLSSLTVGLIGVGRIGGHVKEVLEAMRVKILWLDPHWPQRYGDSRDFMGPKRPTGAEIVSDCDIISLHIPEKNNEGFYSNLWVNHMRPESWLINSSRPSIVDMTALTRAVDDGKIGGAVIDGEAPYKQVGPHIFYTGHTAGRSRNDRIAADEFMVKKLQKLLD